MMFIKKPDTELQAQRKLQKAGALLGFTPHQVVTVEMVREAYRAMVKASHPDSPCAVKLQTYQLDAIRKAKDFLIKHMENDDE